MTNQTKKTKVLFLIDTDDNNQILAVFPELPAGRTYVICYSHLGQHAKADVQYYKELPHANERQYKSLHDEIISVFRYELEVLNETPYEPIKCAITSNSREGRTIIIYKDGGIKIFDQGENWDTQANVINFEPCETEGDKLEKIFQEILDQEEIYEIQKALKAP